MPHSRGGGGGLIQSTMSNCVLPIPRIAGSESVAGLRKALAASERQYLGRPYGEHRDHPLSVSVLRLGALGPRTEPALNDVPGPGDLQLPQLGQAFQRRTISDTFRASFDHDVETLPIRVVPGGQNAIRVAQQVTALLFIETGTEVQRVVEPHGGKWRNMRPAIRSDCGDPEDFRVLEYRNHFLPRCSHGTRAAVIRMKLRDRFTRHGVLRVEIVAGWFECSRSGGRVPA